MIDGVLFDKLDVLARAIRQNRLPFGGIQLVLCGDFLQLPPIALSADVPRSFCFQSKAWASCGLTEGAVLLKQIVRQASDPALADILGEVRMGEMSKKTLALLKTCHTKIK